MRGAALAGRQGARAACARAGARGAWVPTCRSHALQLLASAQRIGHGRQAARVTPVPANGGTRRLGVPPSQLDPTTTTLVAICPSRQVLLRAKQLQLLRQLTMPLTSLGSTSPPGAYVSGAAEEVKSQGPATADEMVMEST